jgi:hypothetical protein
LDLLFPSVAHGWHLPLNALGARPISTASQVDAAAAERAVALPTPLAPIASEIVGAIEDHNYQLAGLHVRGSAVELQAFWDHNDSRIDYMLPAPRADEWRWYRTERGP